MGEWMNGWMGGWVDRRLDGWVVKLGGYSLGIDSSGEDRGVGSRVAVLWLRPLGSMRPCYNSLI